MKVETTSTEVFTPIELKITIETKRELNILYQLFEARYKDLCDILNKEELNEPYQNIDVEPICDAFYKVLSKKISK
jgi:hypothetical protein